MKRFYREIAVTPDNGIALDGKALKTPRGESLRLPTRALAEAIAEEWRAQGGEIDTHSMPLTKLANTAIDGVEPRRGEVVDELARFGEHDHLCYRATEPPDLVRRQNAAWDPLLDWVAERYGARLVVQSGIASVLQPEAATAALRRALETFDPFALAALHVMASICGSLVLAFAVSEKRLPAWEAFSLSQLDETYQAEKWGIDSEAEQRAGHLARELAAASRFLELSRA
jgi:chaperone required for assembly of F1-ATPase